jgi:PEP-CTERM motif
MKKLSVLLFLVTVLTTCMQPAKADTLWDCSFWMFQFALSPSNPGSLGPDPSNCVLQSGANFSSISPLRGAIFSLSDPEEVGEAVSMVFDTGAGTFNVFDDDGDFFIPSTITSSSFDTTTDIVTMQFTVNSGTPFGGDPGTAQVGLSSPTATPEPSSLALLGAGVIGLGLFRGRWRRDTHAA